MKRITFLIGILATLAIFIQSCNNGKTYAEMKEEEKEYIQDFINDNNIQVINENNFDPSVKMADNQFVLFQSDGIYLHIDSLGTGKPFYSILDSISKKQSGVRLVVLARFLEYSLMAKDTLLTNFYSNDSPEQFYYAKSTSSSYYSSASTSTTFGRFFVDANITTTIHSMQTYYGTSVPGGWLKPLQYVGDGGRVKVIVPSEVGTSTAQTNVRPYYYELQYKLY